MSKKVISAVDIGSSKICTVIATLEEDENIVNVIGYSVVPSLGVKKGIIVNINEALTAIQESIANAEKMAGIAISEVFVSINGKSIFSNNTKGVVAVTGHEITEDDIKRVLEAVKTMAIPPQLRKLVHILPREYIVDSQCGIKQPLGMTGSRLEVDAHVISALTTTIYNIEKIFGEISITCIPVFVGYASAQAVLTNTEKELGVFLLDIGHSTTSITIYQDDSITYSSSINLGSQSVTNDLAVGLQINSNDAEKLKRNIHAFMDNNENSKKNSNEHPFYLKTDNALANVDDSTDDLIDISALQISNLQKLSKRMYEEIVDCRLEELFNLVSINITNAGFSFKQPAGVVLTGGGAKLYGITRKASKFFGIPARVGYPQGLGGPLIDEILGPEFACVQGLILVGLDFFFNEQVNLIYGDPTNKNDKSFIEKIVSFFKNVIP